MQAYRFYGWQEAGVPAVDRSWPGIDTPLDLYSKLSQIWCAETCAPRLRTKWSAANRTCGQCSITAFLVQDIFGGEVYSILRPDGSYHCYNVVESHTFDLTSEQFAGEALRYRDNPTQQREEHFAKEEKRLRYELLEKRLLEKCREPSSESLSPEG